MRKLLCGIALLCAANASAQEYPIHKAFNLDEISKKTNSELCDISAIPASRGKYLEKEKRYAEAFEAYRTANSFCPENKEYSDAIERLKAYSQE